MKRALLLILLAAPALLACSYTIDAGPVLFWQGTSASGLLPESPDMLLFAPLCPPPLRPYSTDAWLRPLTSPSMLQFEALSNPRTTLRTGTIGIVLDTGSPITYQINEVGSSEAPWSRQIRVLYQHVLGRDPDAAGFAAWTSAQQPQNLPAAIDSFLSSTEAFNTDFAAVAAYQAATGAPPAFVQYAAAVSALRGGITPDKLFAMLAPRGFTAANLYQNLLARVPTPAELQMAAVAGLPAWFETLIGYSAYPLIPAQAGAIANEFQSTNGFRADHANALYVSLLYFALLGRDPDPGGLDFWLSLAASSQPGMIFQGSAAMSSRLVFLTSFAASPEFQQFYQ